MKLTTTQIRAKLEEAKARLKDVQERGNEAINKYDLRLGYDADFYLNRCPLLANHVIYYEKMLENETQGQLSMFE
ncbi:hypothetical protein [Maribacter polysaccharolyticus]|uniref:hypothetical protein n=1 Tax=Maribacter polysaccharolyticus TaxID=3020831 RepID=UPI00237F5A80|nr:hypothetical protein [Maribacter polysaccharolyticus]MDE3744058.1 hypothetical protein [Maribacter polysaccharolyticus]